MRSSWMTSRSWNSASPRLPNSKGLFELFLQWKCGENVKTKRRGGVWGAGVEPSASPNTQTPQTKNWLCCSACISWQERRPMCLTNSSCFPSFTSEATGHYTIPFCFRLLCFREQPGSWFDAQKIPAQGAGWLSVKMQVLDGATWPHLEVCTT